MVHTGVLAGLLLLSLFSSVVSADEGDLNALPKIIRFFETRYKPYEQTSSGEGAQYAVAINVPAGQCGASFEEKEFLREENTNNVKNDLETRRLYTGKQMVAARPKGTGSSAVHSERALLICDSSQAVAPVQNLLNTGDRNGCVVFYTYNSPCLDYCLNQGKDDNEQNRERVQKKRGNTNVQPAVKKCILDSLSILTNHPGPKAFVFSQVYRKDKEKAELLASALKVVAEKVPLYKCNTNSCIKCLDNNNKINSQCLS
ncbi:uncharacterized protein LOC125726918 [Brienomyrus brachyistius]|uniref:uncharacterized protein LOC125726918 n=1 Tax=Brienomyrus brachyistius TaxID=42636 RepID=UPI0020B1B406|nr:uncharacterized protein LOC125726918 [Brienomyrus brachyistius]